VLYILSGIGNVYRKIFFLYTKQKSSFLLRHGKYAIFHHIGTKIVDSTETMKFLK